MGQGRYGKSFICCMQKDYKEITLISLNPSDHVVRNECERDRNTAEREKNEFFIDYFIILNSSVTLR